MSYLLSVILKEKNLPGIFQQMFFYICWAEFGSSYVKNHIPGKGNETTIGLSR